MFIRLIRSKNTSEENYAARNDVNEDVRAESVIECVAMTETRIMFRVRLHERSFSTLRESILISFKP